MQITNLKFVVDDAPIPVPDTGYNVIGSSSATGDKQMVLAIFAIVGVVLATLLIVAFIRYRNKAKMGFNIKASKGTMMFRSFLALAAIGGLGYGATFLYNVMAAGNVDFTTKGDISANAVLKTEGSVIACATDEVKVNQDLPAGYALKMSSSGMTLLSDNATDDGRPIHVADTDDDEAATGRGEGGEGTEGSEAGENTDAESTDGEGTEAGSPAVAGAMLFETKDGLAEGTWSYIIAGDENAEYKAVPDNSAVIKTVSEATESGDTTKVKFCANFAAGTKAGTYAAAISYEIDATPVNYHLGYSVDGGTYPTATTPEEQDSGETIDASYTFTVTDIVPTPTDPEATFYGWSTTGDSTSEIYHANDEVVVTDQNTTLKAIFGYGKHTLSFNNGVDSNSASNTVTNFPDTQDCIIMTKGETTCAIRITKKAPRRQGYTFLGWGDSNEGLTDESTLDQHKTAAKYASGSVIELSADKEVVAIWWNLANNPDYQAELRWDENPRDLDSHLVVVRNSDRAKIAEVYFHNKTANIASGVVKLDVDDTNGYGPETLTIDNITEEELKDYTFYYFVKLYAGEGSLLTSGARISIMFKDGTVKEFDVNIATETELSDEDKIWNVFALKNGEVVERNTITSREDLSY